MALARKPFVVIDAEILSSSVWSEAAHVKLVWLTLLILCDTEGYVGAAIPGIARAAGVTVEQTRDAIRLFMLPDPDSRTQSNEGRRLETAERGFRILNFREHLDRLSADRTRARERVRKFRAKKRESADGNVTFRSGNREQGIGNREKEGKTETPAPLPPDERAERRIKESKVGDERRLLALVSEMADHDPKKRDTPELMLLVTSYDKPDGKRIGGCVNPATLSFERVRKSIEDAEAILAEWKANGTGQASTAR